MYAGALLFAAAAVVSCSDDAKTYGRNDMSYGGAGAESSKTFSATAAGGEVAMRVEAPGAWTIESVIEQDWCEPSQLSGTGTKDIVLTVGNYTNEESDRFAQFKVVRDGSTPYLVTVTQTKLDVPMNAADEATLRDIYESTQGAKWEAKVWDLNDIKNLPGVDYIQKNGLRYVSKIDLSGCGLKGSLPARIDLPMVTTLYFNSNSELTGSIPTTWNTPALLDLNLAWCAFTGKIPQGLANISSLTKLLIDHNQLSGAFPHIWNVPNLAELNTGDNANLGYLHPKSLGHVANWTSATCKLIGFEIGFGQARYDAAVQAGEISGTIGDETKWDSKRFPTAGNTAWQAWNGNGQWIGWGLDREYREWIDEEAENFNPDDSYFTHNYNEKDLNNQYYRYPCDAQ